MWIRQSGRDRIINIDTGTYVEIRKFMESEYILVFVNTRGEVLALTPITDNIEVAHCDLDSIFCAISSGQNTMRL